MNRLLSKTVYALLFVTMGYCAISAERRSEIRAENDHRVESAVRSEIFRDNPQTTGVNVTIDNLAQGCLQEYGYNVVAAQATDNRGGKYDFCVYRSSHWEIFDPETSLEVEFIKKK